MRLFDPRNHFFRTLARATDVVGLSLLWTFLSLPVVTVGAASAALYDSTAVCVRQREEGAYTRFFKTFKATFLPSLPSVLVWSALTAGLWAGGRVLALMAQAGEKAALVQLVAFCVLLVVPAGIVCWQFPLLAHQRSRFGELNLRAAHLTLRRLPVTVLLTLMTALCAYLCWHFWVPVLVLPGLCALAQASLLEPIFAREGLPPLAGGDTPAEGEEK